MPPVPVTLAPSPILEVPPHTTPQLSHTLQHDSSVLTLVVGDDSIYTGTQNGEIVVWSLDTFQRVHSIQAHKRSVMCLFLSEDRSLLFSSASDPIVNVWCPKTMGRLYEIYSTNDSFGDIFSLAYSSQYHTIYYGAQNTSIQWINLRDPDRRVSTESASHPDRRNHRFFDSRAVGGAATPRPTDERYDLIPRPYYVLETDKRASKMFAHFGYVYCMLIANGISGSTSPEDDVLVSGGGDGTIKAWKLGGKEIGPDGYETGIEEIMVLGEDDANSVMSMAVDGSFLYSGKLDGVIELWDLDTKQKLRVIKAHTGDVMSIQMGWGYLWSAARSGTVSKHSTAHYGKYEPETSEGISQKYQCLTQWKAHDGKILSSGVTTYEDKELYISGANDNTVAVWLLPGQSFAEHPTTQHHEDMMITSLREFVSYKTVSSWPEYAEDCRRGASFLRSLFKKLGGDVEMLSADDKLHHPVVFAKFSGKASVEQRKRIMFYGHYDVVPADPKKGTWDTDPFQLTGLNGYLYGRGVSDNKGPIMAALYAVTDLMQSKSLDSDIVFLIEGQEESGSRGFKETVRKYKERIGHVDYIILANSYWLDDETPCLTYGLRGVMHATVCVESNNPDLHSGVDGSYMINEPLSDLMMLLTKLKGPRNRVMLPGFYDDILPLTAEEEARYDDILSVLMEGKGGTGVSAESLKASLMARWREPNLTHHKIKVSGPDGSLISSHANAKISVRLVPGQKVEKVTNSLAAFLKSEFENLESTNKLSIQIDEQAEPWLGDPGSYIFRTMEDAVLKAWDPLFARRSSLHTSGATPAAADNAPSDGQSGTGRCSKLGRPLYIREGGSIPAIRFLEKEFDAPAAHLPCGQASDSAHLGNERLRVLNLLKSREIFRSVFQKL
ncbi:WD domain-containing protein [Poronia punctata]|nr:WD domain-containing protein [Poronia punctata]